MNTLNWYLIFPSTFYVLLCAACKITDSASATLIQEPFKHKDFKCKMHNQYKGILSVMVRSHQDFAIASAILKALVSLVSMVLFTLHLAIMSAIVFSHRC